MYVQFLILLRNQGTLTVARRRSKCLLKVECERYSCGNLFVTYISCLNILSTVSGSEWCYWQWFFKFILLFKEERMKHFVNVRWVLYALVSIYKMTAICVRLQYSTVGLTQGPSWQFIYRHVVGNQNNWKHFKTLLLNDFSAKATN